MTLKHWQVWGINHSRKPVPMFDHHLGKEILPNVKSEPPLMQLWTIPMVNVTACFLCSFKGRICSAKLHLGFFAWNFWASYMSAYSLYTCIQKHLQGTKYILGSLSGLCNFNMCRLHENEGFKQNTNLNRKERIRQREF